MYSSLQTMQGPATRMQKLRIILHRLAGISWPDLASAETAITDSTYGALNSHRLHHPNWQTRTLPEFHNTSDTYYYYFFLWEYI
jgi:hypothetical protein